jgi:hypothetical protein
VSLLATAVGLPFRAVAAARGARAVHPQGFLCDVAWTVERTSPLTPTATVLQAGTRLEGTARVSRGAGLPEPLPDFLGIAVRLHDVGGPGRHRDLLFNASADLPLVHHVFLPAGGWTRQSYSTCLPYRAGAGLVVLGLRPARDAAPAPDLATMREAVGAGLSYDLVVAEPLGRWERPLGTLRLSRPFDGEVDFDPITCSDDDLRPATWINRVRAEAYRQSRQGRGAEDRLRDR